MIRVTYASYDDDPPIGGQGVVLHGMREAVKRRGVHVHTVSGRGTNTVHFARITGRAPIDLSLQLNRNRLILYRDNPDVIHAFGGPGGVLVWRPLIVPLIYTAHHTYRQAFSRWRPGRTFGPLEARAYRRAAMVLAVSKSTADAVRAMGIPARRVEVVASGIDIPEINGLAHEPGRLLFVGRLEPEKGVHDALRVVQGVVDARPGATGVFIGQGSLAKTVQRQALQSGGRIEYLGGVDAATLQKEYARASVLLMPSRYEGLGMVALEAQAAGTPVVGYSVDGLRDAIGDGGLLVPLGDAAALQARCLELFDDPARGSDLGEHGRAHVRREHSWDDVARHLEEIYRRVVAAF
jgi:glycosyltransferase involved in cell wall biosynthesis